jgi:hypothetical protein
MGVRKCEELVLSPSVREMCPSKQEPELVRWRGRCHGRDLGDDARGLVRTGDGLMPIRIGPYWYENRSSSRHRPALAPTSMSASGPEGKAGSNTAQRPTSFVCVRRDRMSSATSPPRRFRNALRPGPVIGMLSGPLRNWMDAKKRFGWMTGICAMKWTSSSSSATARASP